MDKQSYRVYRGYIGIMEKKMETMIIMALYWCYTGIMENKMETTIYVQKCSEIDGVK